VLVFLATNLASASSSPQIAALPAAPAGAALHPRAPFSYRIAGTEKRPYKYDAKAEIQAYALLVADAYAQSLADGQALKTAIDAFLASPDDDTLARARDAWLYGRRSWELTEAFRFYDGPVDVAESGAAPLARLDGWPVDPAAIDYVDDNPTAGIVNNMKLALTRATLLGRQSQAGPDRAVTTGWHAVEFLLWGQEPPALGETGDRPPTDYLAGQPNNDRRRTYLRIVSEMLVEDLRYLAESWEPKSRNYATDFRLLNQREALGRMLNGVAQLAGRELATNRLATALDTRDRRKLTSRFSGGSYQDFVFAIDGIHKVWTGESGREVRPGLQTLIARVDPLLAQRIDRGLDRAADSLAALYTPLDRETLAAAANAPARETAEQAIAALKQLASLLRDAGQKLGVSVDLPD
jgi:putative iron-regulated protein